jgi:uncharacterized protein YutD
MKLAIYLITFILSIGIVLAYYATPYNVYSSNFDYVIGMFNGTHFEIEDSVAISGDLNIGNDFYQNGNKVNLSVIDTQASTDDHIHNITDYFGDSDFNNSVIRVSNITGHSLGDYNYSVDLSGYYNTEAQLTTLLDDNYLGISTAYSAFTIENITSFFGDDSFNATVLRTGNMSHIGNVTNNDQLANGAGYITSYTDTQASTDDHIHNITDYFGDSDFNNSVIRVSNITDHSLGDYNYSVDLSGYYNTEAQLTTLLDDDYVDVDESPTAADISGSFSAGLTIGASKVQDDEIDYAAVTLADFVNDVGFIANNSPANITDLRVQTINGTDFALFNKSIDLSGYISDVSAYQKIADIFTLTNLTLYFGDDGFNGSVLRVSNMSNIRESSWDWANNDSLVLDNDTIIRSGNVTNIMIGNTSWAITAVNGSINTYYNHSLYSLSQFENDLGLSDTRATTEQILGNFSNGTTPGSINFSLMGDHIFANLTLCDDNEILKMDGSSWNCEADATGGAPDTSEYWNRENTTDYLGGLNSTINHSIDLSSYYNTEADLTGLLDDNYLDIATAYSNFQYSNITEFFGVQNESMIKVGNESWAIKAVNDSINTYYNHSIDLSGYLQSESDPNAVLSSWRNVTYMNYSNIGFLNITGNFSVTGYSTAAIIEDKTADLTSDNTLLTLQYLDNNDPNGYYLKCIDDSSGTPDTHVSIGNTGNIITTGAVEIGDETHDSVTVNGVSKAIQLGVHGANTANEYVSYMDRMSDTHSPTFVIARARGDHGSPAAVADDDILGQFGFLGYDDTDWSIGAQITAQVDGTPADSDLPTELLFKTTPAGASTPITRMVINPNGDIVFYGNVNATLLNATYIQINGSDLWDMIDNGTINRSIDLSGYISDASAYQTEASAWKRANVTDFFGVENVSMIKVGNESWAITAVNDSINTYYNHSIDLGDYNYSVDLSGYYNTEAQLTTLLDDDYVDVDESPAAGDVSGSFSAGLTVTFPDTDNLDIANTSMLDNGTVLRTGNLSDIGRYINATSNITSVITGLNASLNAYGWVKNDTDVKFHNATFTGNLSIGNAQIDVTGNCMNITVGTGWLAFGSSC